MSYRSRRSFPQDPRWIELRYACDCARCGAPIPVRGRAFYYPNTRTVFCSGANCGQQESRDFGAAAADEAMLGG